MELTNDQRAKIAEWVKEGCSLSEIQTRINEEFGESMTYMDVRFLVLDLDLEVRDREDKRDRTPSDPLVGSGEAESASPPPGGVSVEVDRVMKPGSVVSGSVTFSDGVSATWSLDQFGRLALDPGTPGYRPSEQDVAEFQQELRKALEGQGF